MIEMTIALPMYRSKYNGWIALESLVRQKDVPCEWELVVAEETIDCFGEEAVREYTDKLKAVGCSSIKYISLSDHIPLSLKWILTAENSESKYFLLQAVDDFSQPNRLKETYLIFEQNNSDWIRSMKGYFYDISSNKVYLFDQSKSHHPGGLNMATRTSYIQKLPRDRVFRIVDKWIYSSIASLIKTVNVSENKYESWKQGVYTNGLNRISLRRTRKMESEYKVYSKTHIKIEQILEQEIIDRLKKSYILERKMMQ